MKLAIAVLSSFWPVFCNLDKYYVCSLSIRAHTYMPTYTVAYICMTMYTVAHTFQCLCRRVKESTVRKVEADLFKPNRMYLCFDQVVYIDCVQTKLSTRSLFDRQTNKPITQNQSNKMIKQAATLLENEAKQQKTHRHLPSTHTTT